jgi:hypothetical protein
MSNKIVTHHLDDSTTLRVETEPPEGFRPTGGADEYTGRVREAVRPTAEAVPEKVKETRPDHVELRFRVTAADGANWLIAKATGEAYFGLTLTCSRPVRKEGPGAQ